MVWEAHVSEMKKVAFNMHINPRHVLAELV